MKFKLLTSAILFTLLTQQAHSDFYEPMADDSADFFDDFYGSEEMIEIATGTKTQIYKAPAVASVFSAEQIKKMGATDIDDVLETVPGLHIARNSNGYLPIYSFRGAFTQYNPQVLMLINGIPITNNFQGNRNQTWGGMPVEAISRIEVIRGPGSALYGADAFSGVINIITKNADDIKQNEVAIRGGGQNTTDAWLILGDNQNDIKYSAILEYHKTDGSDRIIEADRQTILDETFGTKVSHAPGKVSTGTENLDFRGEINYQDFTLRLGYQLRDDNGVGIGLAEALDPTARKKSARSNIDLTYQAQLSSNIELTTQAAYFHTTQEIKNNYYIYPKGADLGHGSPYTDGFIGNPEVWEQHYRFNMTGHYTGLDKHAIRFGVGYHLGDLYKTKESKNFGLDANGNLIAPGDPVQDVSDSSYIFLRETERTNHYLFIQDVWNIASDWDLTAGIRHDNYSDFGNTTNPRLALVWSTSLNLSTKLLYGKAFRAPSFAETGNINNPVALGNPDLRPEKMETLELVFDFHPSDNWNAIVNFYQYVWEDIIQYVPEEIGNVAQNFGQQTAYGVEIEVNKQLSQNVSLAANYAWSEARNDTNDTDVAYVPKHLWYLQLDWNLSENLNLNVQNHYVMDRERDIGDLRDRIDNYWLTNLTLRWQPETHNYEAALLVKNLFDEDAREPSMNNGANVNLPNDLPLPGRMVMGEIRYHF
mgnify:CR=1 FL=1